MKVLLVNPPMGLSSHLIGLSRPPLGLAYLASVLKDYCQVKIIDFNVERESWNGYPYSEFDIVGISVHAITHPVSFGIAELAKNQGATVVMGGPHVSFLEKEVLKSGVVDYVVRNEGEHSFLSLVKFLSKEIPFEEVRGVSYSTNGQLSRTPDAPFIYDLDSLPLPAREFLPLELYREKAYGRPITTLITSRGCPFGCEFCSIAQFFGVRWRSRSLENILEEIELLYKKYNYRALSFVDANFTLNPNRAVKLSEKIIKQGWDLIWLAESHVNAIVNNPGMIQIMARAGLKEVFIGFESGSQEVLDGYEKKALVSDALKAVKILRKNNVEITGSFILGALNETKDMMKETINFAKRINPTRAQFTILTPYPGTRLYEKVKDRLLTKDWETYSCINPIIRLEHISPKELRRIWAKAYLSFYGRVGKIIENIPNFHIHYLVPKILFAYSKFLLSGRSHIS